MSEPRLRQTENAPTSMVPNGNHPTALTDEEKLVGRTLKKSYQLTEAELAAVNTKKGLMKLLSTKNVDNKKRSSSCATSRSCRNSRASS